jgi:hypothetical protein
MLVSRSLSIIWSDAGRTLACTHGVAINSFPRTECPPPEVALVVRIGLGADEADIEDTGSDEYSGNISTIAPRGRVSLESPRNPSRLSATRSRRRATLTVSGHCSTHLTEAELEEELRDFADVSFREEIADTVDEERPRQSKEEVLLNPVVI